MGLILVTHLRQLGPRPGQTAGDYSVWISLSLRRSTNDNGVGTSLFSGLNNTTTAYDSRVRAMVAMLMSLARFQEQ